MAVTDLTGYTFSFNLYVDYYFPISGVGGDYSFDLNFTSNGNNYTNLNYYNYAMDDYTSLGRGDAGLKYDSTTVWDEYSEWSNVNYTDLVITGGADVTNPNLIAWLEANGTLTPPTTPSIAEKLLAVNQIKQDIKSAIVTKGVAMNDVPFTDYATKIDLLPAVVELTQAQYDALSVYDNNTYYLIVEE